MVLMTLILLYITAHIIQMMAFAPIMAIWKPGITLRDHLKIIPILLV